ncbi:MAG: trypsin-like serine protease, partial [Planctomycetota bacterium]
MFGLAGTANAITNGQPDGDGHPYVGLVVFDVYDPVAEENVPAWRVTGVLIAPTVLLTAGHATDGTVAARVWFDETVEGNAEYPYGGTTSVEGTPYTHPDFALRSGAGGPILGTRDVGVVILDEPVSMAEYGALPDEGIVDTLPVMTDVDLVGYGVQSLERGGGRPNWVGDKVRLFAPAKLIGTAPSPGGEFMRVSENPAQGKGGSTFGDSGGPVLSAGTNTILGVNSYGSNFNATGVGYA